MNGMLIIIEKDGVELEVRRIEEKATAHFLSHWQISENIELDRLSIETIILTLNKVINDTKNYIDNLIHPHYIIASSNFELHRSNLVIENRKELDEYERLRALFEVLYEIFLNNVNVKIRMKKIICEKEN